MVAERIFNILSVVEVESGLLCRSLSEWREVNVIPRALLWPTRLAEGVSSKRSNNYVPGHILSS